MSELLLDERIMTWIFLPIIFVTFLISLVKYYFNMYQHYTKTKK